MRVTDLLILRPPRAFTHLGDGERAQSRPTGDLI